ncbi:MAG TPA: OmpA family protein [Acetobacteraceae bacterium]|nr:OmpA family protein [Acetobacteraceae bacterium]
MVAALFLCGCASAPPVINPVDWYHDIEGGPIAKKRPEIPGAEAPYPNLANIPQPPHVIPSAERDRISASLLAERTHAEQEAVLAPLPATGPAAAGLAAAPAAPATGPLTPSPSGESSSIAASPPAASTGAPAPAAIEAQDQGEGQESAPPDSALAAAAAALPSVPAAPPPPPPIAGIAVRGPPPHPFGVVRTSALTLQFPAGSANLTASERARIRAIAAQRGKASIAVMGYGDARESNAASQTEALALGLARASSVASALAADGVPENALRLGAEASGGGATLRLLEEDTGDQGMGDQGVGAEDTGT